MINNYNIMKGGVRTTWKKTLKDTHLEEFENQTGSQELGNDKKVVKQEKETPKKQVGEELIVEEETKEVVENGDEEPAIDEPQEEVEVEEPNIDDEEMPDFLK